MLFLFSNITPMPGTFFMCDEKEVKFPMAEENGVFLC